MTIYAISTGPGISGIAVIRVSGKNASDVVKIYSSSYDGATAGQAGPDGVVNTELNFTSSAIVGGSGVYCSVEWEANALARAYGGYIRLIKT